MSAASSAPAPEVIAEVASNPFAAAGAWQLREDRPKRSSGQTQSTGAEWTPETLAAAFAGRGLKVEWRSGKLWSQCPCPEHDDDDPSLTIEPGRKVGVVVKCRSGAGCTQEAVLKAIGPAPGWRSQPRALQLPEDLDELMCRYHRWTGSVSFFEWEQGRELNGVERASYLRVLHGEQRARIKRVRLARARHVKQCRVLLEAKQLHDDDLDDALLALPPGLGKNQRIVLKDLINVVNDRLAEGKTSAPPYASTTVGERLGLDPRRVREALEGLRERGLIEKVGEMPNASSYDDGTPLYALMVRAPCPLCASDIEAGAGVADLDAHDAAAPGDRELAVEPGAEQPELAPVAVAQLEDLVDPRLRASERSTSSIACGHVDTVDHGGDCPFGPREGPPREPERVRRKREWEARR